MPSKLQTRRGGRVAMQRIANPCTPVRLRSVPPFSSVTLRNKGAIEVKAFCALVFFILVFSKTIKKSVRNRVLKIAFRENAFDEIDAYRIAKKLAKA